MQVKIVIGTIAFMLTMIVLGYAALREPERLEQFTLASHGRSIEEGAEIFANNCATCHGADGKAVSCLSPAGESIACVGRPLQNYFLLCGDTSERMIEVGWGGTKEQFIELTVSAGRTGTVMPAWLNDFGGPMRQDQVRNVSNFVLNWGSDEFCSVIPVTFPWPDTVEEFNVLEIPDPEPYATEPGDATRGSEAYTKYACFSCHGYPDQPGSNNVGPWLGEIAEVGATRVAGESAQQYIYNSILNPNAVIAPECPSGPCTSPSLMPGDFDSRMSTIPNTPQDMADILAYLMGDAYTFP